MTPLVSVVLVSYQTRALTVRCLSALRARAPASPSRSSWSTTPPPTGRPRPWRRRTRRRGWSGWSVNVGFGRAVNEGAAHARGRWLLLINPDTTPVGDVVAAFVEAANADPGAGLYTGRTLRPDGTDDGRSCFALQSLWGLWCLATGMSTLFRTSRRLNPDELRGLDRAVAARVQAASGCLLLADRHLFSRLGGFTPDYFMYSEDIDLCARAAALGAEPRLVPTAQAVHLGGAASTSVNKRVMVLRGKCTYLRLRWTRKRAALGRALLATGIWLRAAGSALTGRARYWRQVWARRREWLAGWPAPQDRPAVEQVLAPRELTGQ